MWILIAVMLIGSEGGLMSTDTREIELKTTVYQTEAECLKEQYKLKVEFQDFVFDVTCTKIN